MTKNICKFCGKVSLWWFISGLVKTCNDRECKAKVFPEKVSNESQ